MNKFKTYLSGGMNQTTRRILLIACTTADYLFCKKSKGGN